VIARRNPFAVQRIHALPYRLAEESEEGAAWGALLARFEALGRRAAVVAPHGHGKTTFLDAFLPRLPDLRIRRVALHDGERRLSRSHRETLLRRVSPEDLLVVDGAEQLGRAAWLHLCWKSRRAAGLLVTAHRPGLLPTLHECRTSPELLAELLRELAGEEALRIGAGDLYARHRGDLREVFFEMYDRWAGRDSGKPERLG
jgi:hypothetical protein